MKDLALIFRGKGAKLGANKQGKTALHFACMNRYYDIAEIVLDYSLKSQKEKHIEYVNMSDSTMSFTSLHFAARAGNYNVIYYLFDLFFILFYSLLIIFSFVLFC